MSGYGLSSTVQRTFEVDKGRISRMDYDASGNLIYYGTAHGTALTSEAKWKIQKLTYDASGNLLSRLWSGGGEAFDQVWNNRASLSYS